METYGELCRRVNETYARTQDIQKTANETGVSRAVVLEAVGFSDEWTFVFDDDQNFWQVPVDMTGVSLPKYV